MISYKQKQARYEKGRKSNGLTPINKRGKTKQRSPIKTHREAQLDEHIKALKNSLELESSGEPAIPKQSKMHSQLIPSADEGYTNFIESNTIQKEILKGTSGHRTKSMVNCSKPM